MPKFFAEPTSRAFAFRTALPIILAAAAAATLVTAVLLWSSIKADEIAIDRQDRLIKLVVSQLQAGIAHDQESSTVWDEAVDAVKRPERAAWVDDNLGSWMHTYFEHDGAYVLDTHDQPVFAFENGTMVERRNYENIAVAAKPLVDALRRKLRNSETDELNDHVLSLGAADVSVVEGHPAVISVKPIISDTGNIEQAPGSEYLHIAVRFLDGGFLSDLGQDYLFDALRFSWDADLRAGETATPLLSASGDPVGYFIWQPYRPGTVVRAAMTPTLAGVLLVAGLSLAWLIWHLRKRSLKLQASEAEIRYLASHDALTGLPNRAMFAERLERALATLPAGKGFVAVLYLDLDRFKQVNDTLGHPIGDELIRQFANRVTGLIRDTDTLSRVGGDEFTVIINGVPSGSPVEALCTRIIDAVNQPFDIDGSHISIGVSIGVAMAPTDGQDRLELTRKADIALYHAKAAGKGRVAVFGKDMDVIVQARRKIEDDLRQALLGGDQIDVFYQPLYATGDRHITGVEALARWCHPQDGWIPPSIFVPVAEDSGLIVELGEQVLRKACRAAKQWGLGKVAVNVSAVELRNQFYAMKVANNLLMEGLQPHQLELEITESALTDENGTCEANVKALRDLGVKIAIDDFGTGFSSLSRLQKFAVDRIKIDQSFVHGFGQSGSDEAIVRAIVTMAKAKGLKTTAEGVETDAQSSYLKEIGCDDIQGFLLAKPLSAAEMADVLETSSWTQQSRVLGG